MLNLLKSPCVVDCRHGHVGPDAGCLTRLLRLCRRELLRGDVDVLPAACWIRCAHGLHLQVSQTRVCVCVCVSVCLSVCLPACLPVSLFLVVNTTNRNLCISEFKKIRFHTSLESSSKFYSRPVLVRQAPFARLVTQTPFGHSSELI